MQPVSQVSPPPDDRRRFAWRDGVFETARRPYTGIVEGSLHASSAVVMITLRGGATRHEMLTDDGHRYDGPDRAGAVSFLPAGCGRRLRLHGVAWQWASLSVRPDLLDGRAARHGSRPGTRSFSSTDDMVVHGVLSEMARLHAADGQLEGVYCDTMVLALTHYLDRRYWRCTDAPRPAKLSAWRLRRICDYIDANLAQEVRVSVLADLAGYSEGHFHRAFLATAGETPLRYIQRRRVEHAAQILATRDIPVAAVALQAGFLSPSHFSRIFQAVTGRTPRAFRASFQTE